MDIRQLQTFVAVADELHFGRAAERLHVVPSAVSQQISRLERELGGTLFDRTSRVVRLTPAGRVLWEEATAVLAAVSRAEAETRMSLRAMTTSLRIGYASPGLGSLILAAVMAYESEFPDMHIDLHELSSPEVVAAVGTGDLDAGFAWQSDPPTSLRRLHVTFRPIIVLVPFDHRFAGCATVTTGDICHEPLVLQRRDTNPQLYDQIHAALYSGGVSPRIRRHVGSGATMTAIVKARDGIGVAVDDGFDIDSSPGMVAIPIDTPPVSLDLLWCATTESAPLTKFVSHVTDFARCAH